MIEIKNYLKKFSKFDITLLSSVSIIFVLLRFPSIFEPYWYGDEGIYEVVGIALRQGRVLYSQIWDNKPPILYLIYALFNGDLFWVRLLSLIVGLASVIIFFLCAKKLFKNFYSTVFSTLFFAMIFATPFIEGNIANAENFMILPTLISFYLLFCVDSKESRNRTILAGLFLSISFLTKIVAVFDFAAFVVILFSLRFFEMFSLNKRYLKKEFIKFKSGIEQEIIFAVSFLVPILLTFIYFAFKGALVDFWHAAFSQNVGYVGYGNYFLFPMGFLILKIVLLALTVIVSYVFRKHLGKSGFIIFVWVAFALFDAFFSNRPYTHYLLTLLVPFSLLLGMVFEDKKLLKITIPALLIIYLLANSNFKFYKKEISYYSNFFKFISGGSIVTYQNFFDPHTSQDYDIANFVRANTTKSEGIFLWGDGSQIYALSGKLPPGRYAAAYHVTSFKNAISETKKAIEKTEPKFIIQTKEDSAISNFLDGYELKYKVDDAIIYERQF